MVRPQIGHGPKATLEEYYVSQEAQELIPESRKELVFSRSQSFLISSMSMVGHVLNEEVV